MRAPSVVDVTLERTLAAVSIVSPLTFFNTLIISASSDVVFLAIKSFILSVPAPVPNLNSSAPPPPFKISFVVPPVKLSLPLLPEIVELPYDQIEAVVAETEQLRNTGLEVEAFGPGAVMIRAVPALLGQTDVKF